MNEILFASPLYIVRELCKKDFRDVLTRLKAAGFDGVELISFFGLDARTVKNLLDDTGLRALGDFVSYRELSENTERVLSDHALVGCSFITVGDLPLDDFSEVSDRLHRLAETAQTFGIRLQFHNHSEELIDRKDGKPVLNYILDNTSPESLCFEPDLGWIEIGGGDCRAYLQEYRDRCRVLHLKDYYATNRSLIGRVKDFNPARGPEERGFFEFRPTGYGIMNYPALMPLCLACEPEWIVTDHDLAYERDSFADLKLSLEYVKNLLQICKK